jgi:hypothetical protein
VADVERLRRSQDTAPQFAWERAMFMPEPFWGPSPTASYRSGAH